jgi:hypothetical protein
LRKRESVKLAAQFCKSFADEIVPAFQEFVHKYKELNLTFLTPDVPQQQPWFVVRDGDFQQATYDLGKITPHWDKIAVEMVSTLIERKHSPFLLLRVSLTTK